MRCGASAAIGRDRSRYTTPHRLALKSSLVLERARVQSEQDERTVNASTFVVHSGSWSLLVLAPLPVHATCSDPARHAPASETFPNQAERVVVRG